MEHCPVFSCSHKHWVSRRYRSSLVRKVRISVHPWEPDSPQLSSTMDRLGATLSRRIPPGNPQVHLLPLVRWCWWRGGMTGQRKEAGGRGRRPFQVWMGLLPSFTSFPSIVGVGEREEGKKDVVFFPVSILFSSLDTVVKETRKVGIHKLYHCYSLLTSPTSTPFHLQFWGLRFLTVLYPQSNFGSNSSTLCLLLTVLCSIRSSLYLFLESLAPSWLLCPRSSS